MNSSPVGFLSGYCRCLIDRQMMPAAIRVAAIVGTVLFFINHGEALLAGQMTTARWISALLSYLVPYAVNIHGRYAGRQSVEKQ